MKRNEIIRHAENLFIVTSPEIKALQALDSLSACQEWALRGYRHKFTRAQCYKIAVHYQSMLKASLRAPLKAPSRKRQQAEMSAEGST